MKKRIYTFAIAIATIGLMACGGGSSLSQEARQLRQFAMGQAGILPNGVWGEIEDFYGGDHPYRVNIFDGNEGGTMVILQPYFPRIMRENPHRYMIDAQLAEPGIADLAAFVDKESYLSAVEAYKALEYKKRGKSSQKTRDNKVAFSSKVIARLYVDYYIAGAPESVTNMVVFLESGDVVEINNYRKVKDYSDVVGKTLDMLVDKRMSAYGGDVLVVE